MEFKVGVSSIRKMRIGLYGGVLIGVALWALLTGFSGGMLLVLAGLYAFLFLFDWMVLRKAPQLGEVLVSLTDDAIESRHFSTRRKRYPWREIAQARAEILSGVAVMQLHLVQPPGQPQRWAILGGLDPSKPYLPLLALTPTDQERLLDAVRARLRGGVTLADAPPPLRAGPRNELAQARELQDRLTALAPTVWVCWALIAANVLIWLFTASQGVGWMTGDAEKLYEFGGNTASAVQDGAWWRLLTSTFLHANALHLLFNMVGLYAVGGMVERIFGRAPFLMIYLGSGLAGSVASLYFGAQQSVSVGASGAVFGIAGALLAVVFRHRESLPRLFNRQVLGGMTVFVGYSLLMGFSRAGVDNAAHMGGLAAGALLGLWLPARFDAARHARVPADRMVLATGLLGAVLAGAALQAPPARVDVGARVETRKAIASAALAFDQAMKSIQQDALDVKAGKMSDREADDRSRTVHAPRMKTVVDQLNALEVDAANPASETVADLRGLARALQAYLAMASVEVDGKMQPVDLQRARQLEAQVKHFNDRMRQRMERQKNRSASGG